MVVQAYKLAARGLAEEIRSSVNVADPKRMSELSIGLDRCLRELEGLRSTLIMYPDTEWGSETVNFP